MGAIGKCPLNVDRYVWFVLWGVLNRVVGVHVYDCIYELWYISVHDAPCLQKNILT